MQLTTANVWHALAWVNSHRYTDDDHAIVVYDGLCRNDPGCITLRVLGSERFLPKHALDNLRDLFAAYYGKWEELRFGVGPDALHYSWTLTPERQLSLYRTDGRIFIQLTDKGTV